MSGLVKTCHPGIFLAFGNEATPEILRDLNGGEWIPKSQKAGLISKRDIIEMAMKFLVEAALKDEE